MTRQSQPQVAFPPFSLLRFPLLRFFPSSPRTTKKNERTQVNTCLSFNPVTLANSLLSALETESRTEKAALRRARFVGEKVPGSEGAGKGAGAEEGVVGEGREEWRWRARRTSLRKDTSHCSTPSTKRRTSASFIAASHS